MSIASPAPAASGSDHEAENHRGVAALVAPETARTSGEAIADPAMVSLLDGTYAAPPRAGSRARMVLRC